MNLRKLIKSKIKPNLITSAIAGILMGCSIALARHMISLVDTNWIFAIISIMVGIGGMTIFFDLFVPYEKVKLAEFYDSMNDPVSIKNIGIALKMYIKIAAPIIVCGIFFFLTFPFAFA